MTIEIAIAILASLLLPLQAATLWYVVSIERRLTRLETLQEIRRGAPPGPWRQFASGP
jgi:hypothetical protein